LICDKTENIVICHYSFGMDSDVAKPMVYPFIFKEIMNW